LITYHPAEEEPRIKQGIHLTMPCFYFALEGYCSLKQNQINPAELYVWHTHQLPSTNTADTHIVCTKKNTCCTGVTGQQVFFILLADRSTYR
jgi:hypothetical protein